MKKLLYLSTVDYSDEMYSGVFKKISYQIKAFQKANYDVDLIYVTENDRKVHLVSNNHDKVIGQYGKPAGVFSKVSIYKYLKNNINSFDYSGVYIRFLGGRTDPWHLKIVKLLRDNHIDMVIEFPTYPYDDEKAKTEIFIDKLFRNQLSRYVSKAVTHAKVPDIFGIPTIKTTNGIDVESIVPISGKTNNKKEIHLIAVASFEIAHGYERIIESLAKYDNKLERPVYIHMVGDGVDKPMYEQLVKEYSLEEYVHFYGRRFQDELLEIYEKADIALGCLGIYKKGLDTVSSLKSVEYVAKGLPMINGFHEELFDNSEDFVCEFANDASHIDMQIIVDWYDKLIAKYKDKSKLRDVIRKFALDTVDISAVMKPIIDYYNKDNKG